MGAQILSISHKLPRPILDTDKDLSIEKFLSKSKTHISL